MSEPTPERWRPIYGYEGLYEVSDWGRIKSLPRNTTRGGIMKLSVGQHGVLVVNLTKDGIQRVHLVHHLVLVAFDRPCPDGLEGCHGDGNPANNRRENLRWDTHEANMQDMIRHGTAHWQGQTHCVNGHEYTPENTKLNKKGARVCVTCASARSRAFYEAHPESYRYVAVAELDPDELQRRRARSSAATARYRARQREKTADSV